jgi:O-antigen/teichoic acid export membrane protein
LTASRQDLRPAAGGDVDADPLKSRENVVRNGTYLVAREAAGMLVRAAGLVLLVRLIGTSAFGLYSGPLLVVSFLASVATCGTDVFLLRRGAEDERWSDVAYSWLLASSVAVAGISVVAAELARPFIDDDRFVPVFQVLALSLPINVLWVPAKCRLERSMAFSRVAIIEVLGDVTLYAVAVPLAFMGFRQWAAVGGYIAWQTSLLISSMAFAGRRPRLVWSWAMLRQMLGFGATAAAGSMLDRARDAVVPVVVGHFGGASGIGVVSLGMRLLETMGFARRATGRLAIVAIGWLRNDNVRLKRALEESMALQVLALGPIVATFAVASPWLIPAVFGPRWSELAYVFPFLALAQLAASVFTMHQSTLLAVGKVRIVATTNLLRLAIIVCAAYPLGERFGVRGASAAVGVSGLGFVSSHFGLRRIVRISYGSCLPLLVMFVPLLATPYLPTRWVPLLFLPLLACIALPGSRRSTLALVRVVTNALIPRLSGRMSAREGSRGRHARNRGLGKVTPLLLNSAQQLPGGDLNSKHLRRTKGPRHRREG